MRKNLYTIYNKQLLNTGAYIKYDIRLQCCPITPVDSLEKLSVGPCAQ
jgi:hypothetical protein